MEQFTLQVAEAPDRCAIWMPDGSSMTFRELFDYGRALQRQFRAAGLSPGDPVLLFLGLGLDLYASAIALLSFGCPILLVEPWMPASRIERSLEIVKPKAFVASTLGKLWGLRNPGVRNIPRWISPRGSHASEKLTLNSVSPDHPGILTFTSGTTGEPKGVVRTHGYLLEQHRIFEAAFHREQGFAEDRPDWSIFANFTFANLASGRTTILMPTSWSPSHLKRISELPLTMSPASLTCGPAFLDKILS
ncbi:MAG: AMP-binding protein, partial [Bdellovibrionales bacterium]|nr:AMP-binding protein [Bdellovibrionales bacterium]